MMLGGQKKSKYLPFEAKITPLRTALPTACRLALFFSEVNLFWAGSRAENVTELTDLPFYSRLAKLNFHWKLDLAHFFLVAFTFTQKCLSSLTNIACFTRLQCSYPDANATRNLDFRSPITVVTENDAWTAVPPDMYARLAWFKLSKLVRKFVQIVEFLKRQACK